MALFQTQHLWVDQAADNSAVLVLDGPGKCNFLDREVLQEIDQALTIIEAEPRFTLCLVRSKKSASFCHGVAAGTWSSLKSADDWSAFMLLGQRICERLSQLRMPTVALVAGSCLAGGLELALACDGRIAVANQHTLLGFTELDVGLLPSWGGISRLLQRVSLQRSLHMLLGGKKLSARDALRWGLVDDVVAETSDELPVLMQDARKRLATDRPKRTWRQRLLEATAWGRGLILRSAEHVLRRRLPDDMPAPWATLAVVRETVQRGPEAGRARASAELLRLAQSTASQNLLRLHVLHDVQRGAARSANPPRHIGILGSTPLALHLAAQSVSKGRDVVLKVADELTLGMVSLQIVKTLEDDVRRGVISVDGFRHNMNRVRPTLAWKGFDELEVVIDAVPTGLAAAQARLRELEQHVPTDTVIASVQPWLALAELGNGLDQPERLVGLHFPAPLGRTPLAEILVTPTTSLTAIQRVRDHAATLGKTCVVIQEAKGSLVQRVLFAGVAETLRLLQEGMLAERIEQALQRFGMAYGPLEYLDWLGMDEFALTAHRLSRALDEDLSENPIVVHMLTERWLGVKTGVGFYRHGSGRKSPNRALDRWLGKTYAANTLPRSKAEQKKLVQQRLVGRMVNEAFCCWDEGVTATSAELDLALMLVGWAPHRGGPCRYVEQVGYAAVVTTLDELARQHGARFSPCPALRKLATP